MIRTLVIDDEPLALQQLAAYVGKIPYLTLVGECQSALEARDIIAREQIDAIFIDINMPDLNGMDFVRSLAAPPIVVFTTAYSEYAIDGYIRWTPPTTCSSRSRWTTSARRHSA